jgi:hypothetical protein
MKRKVVVVDVDIHCPHCNTWYPEGHPFAPQKDNQICWPCESGPDDREWCTVKGALCNQKDPSGEFCSECIQDR